MTTTAAARLELALLDQLTDDQCRGILRIVRSEIERNRLRARLAHIPLPEGWDTDEDWAQYPDTERREIYGPRLNSVQPYAVQRGDGLYQDELVAVYVPQEVAPGMIWELGRSEALDLARKLIAACDEIGRVVS